MSGLPDTTICEADRAATLHAVFVADEQPAFLGLYTGASCTLPTGEVIEVCHRRTPLYDLACELEKRGYGDCRLQAYTPTGTPSLRGLVKVMAGMTVNEGSHGLKRRKYRPAKACESAADAREPLSRTRTPDTEEMPVTDSTGREKAA